MRRIVLVRAIIVLAIPVFIVGNAPAAPIGINLVGNDPNDDDKVGPAEAGLKPQTNWNDLYWQGSNLTDADGNATAVDVAISTSELAFNGWVPIPVGTVPGNNLLMRGYLHNEGSAWTITLSGLDSEYDSEGYDLVVYYDGANGSSEWITEYAVACGGTTLESIYARDETDTVAWDGSFVEAVGTNADDATDGNYVRFTGLTANSLTLTATPVDFQSGDAPINGLQVLPAPEPATLGLLAAGLATTFLRRRRR